MAEKNAAAPEAGTLAADDKSSGNTKAPLLIAAVNTLAAVIALGAMAYTRLIYKRPPITESNERLRIDKAEATPTAPASAAQVEFKPVTINIEANPSVPKPADGTGEQLHGKLHYVTVGFVLEIRDASEKQRIEELRPVIMDTLLGLLGRKAFHELATVQGRYLLRTQIIDAVNDQYRMALADPNAEQQGAPAKNLESIVSNVYFTQFIVQ